ncbi:YqhR family membrane protein [Paenibacillus dendritiformis]|uniref:YqhR family membrane protein n=1 Tax=Paenibacillus dendritiformis TaxID=130049 RepID=UPI0020C24980|nr:YqhR family membrane protein [Paenibacillus dendritiformis]CAH8771593.1 YqhR family membrane protein [Paenibacillus dendritiformis]
MNERQTRMQQKRTNPFSFGVLTGFFAGLIWGGLHWLGYIFSFTIIVPGFLVEPFYKHAYLTTVDGQLLGLVAFIVFSILAALLYVLVLRKVPGPWAGVVYGLVWWVILFVIPGPLLGLVPPVRQTTWNTIWTESCTMLLWGLFIGYTVATEFNEEREREPQDPDQSGAPGDRQDSPDKGGNDGGGDASDDRTQPQPVM